MKSPPKTLREIGTSWALSSRRRAVTTISSIERLALVDLCLLFAAPSSANELPAARARSNADPSAMDDTGAVERNFIGAGGIASVSPDGENIVWRRAQSQELSA